MRRKDREITDSGRISIVTDPAECRHGLELLMEHTTGTRDWVFNDRMLSSVLVFRLDVQTLSCKEHL